MLAKTISSIHSLASVCCTMADHLDVIGTIASSQFTSHLLDVNDSNRDSEESVHTTCASPRLDVIDADLGRDLKDPPLPISVTELTIGGEGVQEDVLTWASDITSEEHDTSLPSDSINSPRQLEVVNSRRFFYTTFAPSFHHTEFPDEDGILPPIVDTGATHCLLPLRWMTTDQAENCKKIHLKVASGISMSALLHDNIIYCSTVTRPPIYVGQLKSMLDLRFIWSDSAPLLVACSGGLKYILLEASVFHNLPVINSHEMMVLLEATHHYTATGTLWNAATWSKKLNRRLSLFHGSTPSHPIRLPQDDASFTDDPQVMFSSMQTEDLLAAIDETPLLPSLQVFSLQSSSSCSQALPPSSSDVLYLPPRSPRSMLKIRILQLRMRID